MKNKIVHKSLSGKATIVKYLFTGLALIFTSGLFAQETKPLSSEDTLGLFSNGLFDTLFGVIILLAIIIAVIGGVLKNVARFATERKKKNNGTTIGIIALIFFLSSSVKSVAQTVTSGNSPSFNPMGLNLGVFIVMMTIITLEIIIIAVLVNAIQLFVRREEADADKTVVKKEEPSFLEKFNASVPLEKEADILMDHNYDGIQELDNDLPPWWKYGFYVTIIFAVVYLIHFHVTKTGDLQLAEYNKSMDAAHEAKEAYQKMDANNVTESNVKMITDKHELSEAENAFKENCAVCHGKLGEGGVGPNLTDEYWVHGGSIKDLFVTIKYGWPDKGMKSWQADFTPLKINELASYIKTLRGTNPPNGKAPQGDIYKEEVSVSSDSTKTDSTKVIAPAVDSTKAGSKI